jgi:surfeit locus 1 family protein
MRRLLVPAISTVVMLAVLLGLGFWQLERRAWKADLLARIDQAERLPAIPMPAAPEPFAKVSLQGRLRTDLQALYGAEVRVDTLGAHLIMPLEADGSYPVLVDLGWVPMQRRNALVLPSGPIEGFVRPAEHAGTFSAPDNPEKRLFYTLDPAPIAAAFGLPRVAPFVLVAVGQVPTGVFPDPVRTLPRPPDNHLQYALTWFGFALTLLIIFSLYARRALAKKDPP